MAVPEIVRAVDRPPNTVVVAYGKNKDHFAVKIRIGCKRVVGKKNPRPEMGPTIGHIITTDDGKSWKYVPNDGILRIQNNQVDWKDWGNAQICLQLTSDLLEELMESYSVNYSEFLYCSAILGACYPGVSESLLMDLFNENYISEIYPNIDLS